MDWPERLYQQSRLGEPFVQITLVDIKGSAPQILGAKALVGKNGLLSGTVGGGKVEAKAVQAAQEMLSGSGESTRLVTWNLIRDVGMTCGGIVSFLFEAVCPQAWNVVVFGAGHVAQELVPLLCRLDCQVTCLDGRKEWLNRFAKASNLELICIEDLKSQVRRFPSNSFFVSMTQGHAVDVPILAEILMSHPAPFVGVIGSAAKAAVIRKDLRALGLSEDSIARVHCPIGLNFGNNTPVEISLSVVAQLLQERDRLQIGLTREAAFHHDSAQEPEQNPTA